MRFLTSLAALAVVTTLRSASADSLIRGATMPRTSFDDSMSAVFRSTSPFDHLDLLSHASEQGATFLWRFIERHAQADPDNPLRILDAGIAFVTAGMKRHNASLVRRGETYLAKVTPGASDPRMLVVAAIVYAQADWELASLRARYAPTARKKHVAVLLRRACELNARSPVASVVEVVREFVGNLQSGFDADLSALPCGPATPKPPPNEGLHVERYPGGAVHREIRWRAGKLDGMQRSYFESGALEREVRHEANWAVGVEREWYPTGKLKMERAYGARGLLDGPYRSWHPNGSPEREGAFRASKQVGVWKRWSADGTLVEQIDNGEGAR